jgi:hypothetical protein
MYDHLPAPPTPTTTDELSDATLVVPTRSTGWYPDPHGGSSLRYFGGSSWTDHRHDPHAVTTMPPPAAASGQQIVVNTYVAQSAGGADGGPKSAVVAFVLTFIFGPLGMLYSTVAGGLIMLLADIVLIPLTFGLALPILWPIQLIWAVMAANNANRRAGGNANAGPSAGGLANRTAS